MAYETGTATSPNDLLDKLRLFLVANGWSVNSWAAVGSGYRLHIQKGNLFFNFRSYVNEWPFVEYYGAYSYKYGIALNGSDSYNAGSDWDKQPGAPIRTATGKYIGAAMWCRADGVTSYYFFLGTDPKDYVHVAIRFVSPNIDGTERWTWMSFGDLIKFGTWTGGAYFTASRDSYNLAANILRADNIVYGYQKDRSPFDTSFNNASGNGYVRITDGAIDGWATTGCPSTSVVNYLTAGKFLCGNCYTPNTWYIHVRIPAYDQMYKSLANQMNGLGILMPISVFWQKGITEEYWYPLGTIPDMYFTRVTPFTYGDTYQFGSLDFIPFPWSRIVVADNFVNGGVCRKIT